MYDILPPTGMCPGSRILFRFWKISGNISEMVKDRHIVAMKAIMEIVCGRMAPIWVTFSDLEGHFCCLKPLCLSAVVIRVHDGVLAE